MLSIGDMAYLREPERNGDICGLVVAMGDGMARLDFGSRQASYFYNELC